MKKPILILSILLFTISVKSQILEWWSPPIALTDSTSNNSNPVVAVYPYDNPELYMFYEKGVNPFREIWWRKISEPMSDEQMLIGGWPEVDYRNPQILLNNFLIFECNIYENYDLFGVKFDENGLAGDIFRLTNTELDENDFCCYSEYSYYSLCCWVSDGNILVAEPQESQDTLIFTDIEIIDSVACFNPVCRYNYVGWQKMVNNNSHIYYSIKTYPLYQWTDPESIIDTGNNINLTISNTAIEFSYGDNNLCWQAEDRIYFSDLDGDNIYSPEIPGIETYSEPGAISIIWFTDYYPEYYSFAGETDSVRNIYFMDENSIIINITDDTFINKNPGLFIGRGVLGDYEVINIWQTEINGYDVLYGSIGWYQLVYGKINEDERSQINLSPNPFSKKLNIKLINVQTEVALLEIFSISGEKLFQREIQGQANTKQSISWNPKSEGVNLSEGIYFVKLTQGESSIVRKVIYSK